MAQILQAAIMPMPSWEAIQNDGGLFLAAVAQPQCTFEVTSKTDLNAFAHPEFFTNGFIRSIDGAQPEIDTAIVGPIAPLDPAAFSPQYETFEWQESIQY
jgi:hypothetical protein